MDEQTEQRLKEIIRQIVRENPMGIDKDKLATESLERLTRKIN